MSYATPVAIADAALDNHCTSVAFTYNDPVIFMEYAVDTAIECKKRGVKTIAVTAGYIKPGARKEFFRHIDAVNVDLKAFTEDFYRKQCAGSLARVLETLEYIKHDTGAWLEITNLIIPGENDSRGELEKMCRYIYSSLGPGVPLHFSAFHPDYKMIDKQRTSRESLTLARKIARNNGLHFVYTGNVEDLEGDTTFCPGCNRAVIERNWYEILSYHLDEHGRCICGRALEGHYSKAAGTWGRKRQPVAIQ